MTKETDDVGALTEKLGLQFVGANSKLHDEFVQKIDYVSYILKGDLPLPELPTHGFLEKPLTATQATELDKLFGEQYANEAVNLQEKLGNSVTIKEEGERMVSLPDLFRSSNVSLYLSERPFNESCGVWAGKQRIFWVRETVAGKILKAGGALQGLGIVLRLEDGFRSLGVQEGYFLNKVKAILQTHPEWNQDWDKIWNEARSKIAVSPFMSGHKSGAALDITMQNFDGTPLSLGNKYGDGGPRVAVKFPLVTQEEWNTRHLFTSTMEMSGLRIYPYENWHASFGDLSAGIQSFSDSEVIPNYVTVYGPIKGFDNKTGKIEPYPREEYFAPFYTKDELSRLLT